MIINTSAMRVGSTRVTNIIKDLTKTSHTFVALDHSANCRPVREQLAEFKHLKHLKSHNIYPAFIRHIRFEFPEAKVIIPHRRSFFDCLASLIRYNYITRVAEDRPLNPQLIPLSELPINPSQVFIANKVATECKKFVMKAFIDWSRFNVFIQKTKHVLPIDYDYFNYNEFNAVEEISEFLDPSAHRAPAEIQEIVDNNTRSAANLIHAPGFLGPDLCHPHHAVFSSATIDRLRTHLSYGGN